MLKKDHILWGVIPGLLLPILLLETWHSYSFPKYTTYDFWVYIETVKLMAPALSLTLLANLGAFFLFLQFKKYRATTGVLLATFFWGAVIVWAKFWGF